MAARGVLRTIEGALLGFWCPGCEQMHAVNSGWYLNGNYDRPTFTPSVLVTNGHYVKDWKGPSCWCTWNREHPEYLNKFICRRCHSFVTDGQIRFLSDSTHRLAGQTVSLVSAA
jgi:hypothetical protein